MGADDAAWLGPLVEQVGAVPGVVAVTLGGSRAQGTHRPDSDWDLGVLYRASARPLDPDDIRALGHPGQVSDLGGWGPVMHGGAWLTVDGERVDLIFRDLDTVERWTAEAVAGRFELLHQEGYLAGAPTYVVAGEVAIGRLLAGAVPAALEGLGYPDALAAAAPAAWRGRRDVAQLFVEQARSRGDEAVATGHEVRAALYEAHARMAEQRRWVLNEKRLLADAGVVPGAAGGRAPTLG